MKRQQIAWAYAWLGYLRAATLTLSGVVAAMTKAQPKEIETHVGPLVAEIVVSVQSWAWFYVPLLLVLAWLLGQLRQRIGDPVVWKELHELITFYRNKVFSDVGSGVQFHRRVTLFKHVGFAFVRWSWPWNNWLIPIVRSGHTTQDCTTRFRIGKKGSTPEGVAGLAWVSDDTVHIEQLPDMLSSTCSDADREAYAEATGMTVQQIQAKPPQGRSFFAIRVEIKGQPWGVLVVDSRQPTIHANRARNQYKPPFMTLLNNLLQRI
ncbi:hypothetical protein [Lysobacter sp. CFH 32150]|uniref:hypothetical protein n=1 Tax=Lysobacter sp. CFH 32150 TaxID=2927128 RepID=UPI001FA7F025|nr:hypothetical protein [Lysobacter sp. CFH 32150]MCI4567569.1 hypothetical protein [Lysobacter sp. CFH 32150]